MRTTVGIIGGGGGPLGCCSPVTSRHAAAELVEKAAKAELRLM